MHLTEEDYEALEIAVGRVLRLYREREELRRKPRTVEESVRLANISTVLHRETRLTEGKYSFDGGKTWFTGDYEDAMRHYLERSPYHAERMTDEEYARAEKAAERKRDAAEGFEE